MVTLSRRALLYLVLVLAVIVVPAIAVGQSGLILPAWFKSSQASLLYIIIGAALLLCWSFHNSREFILLLLLGLAGWSLDGLVWQGNLAASSRDILFGLVALLLPLNFLISNFQLERGLWNRFGFRRLGFVALQACAVAWLVYSSPGSLGAFLLQPILPWSMLEGSSIPQPAIACMAFALLAGILYCTVRPGELQLGRLLALAAVAGALQFAESRELALLYFQLAVLLIIIFTVINAYHLAYRDELTRLPSRRALRQQLQGLGKTYALAMVDVDHFKKLNDSYGHDVGDDVLRLLASRLQKVEGGGRAYRYGGEEFTIVFPGRSATESRVYLDALRDTIAATPFIIRHKKRPRKKPEKRARHAGTKQLKVTVSTGVAEKLPAHDSWKEVIKAADKALYRAKKAGRNRVTISNE